jgi:hypothetical protein
MLISDVKKGGINDVSAETDTRHLPPELQELVDTIISGVIALASRANSNSDSNSLGGTSYLWRVLP